MAGWLYTVLLGPVSLHETLRQWTGQHGHAREWCPHPAGISHGISTPPQTRILSSPLHATPSPLVQLIISGFCLSVVLFLRGLMQPRLARLYITADGAGFLVFLSPSPRDWNYRYVPPRQVYAMLQLKPRVSYTPQECSANRATCPAPGRRFLKLSTLGERGLAYPLLPQLVRTKTPSWFHSFTHAHIDPLYLPILFLSNRVCLLRSRKVSSHFIHK